MSALPETDQSTLPIFLKDLAPLTRKKVHNCFLHWHHQAVIKKIKNALVQRSQSLTRGINVFKRVLLWRRAARQYSRKIKAKCFVQWRFACTESPKLPLKLGIQVMFCHKLISLSFREGPTHAFPWVGTAGIIDMTAPKTSTSRYRTYVVGKMELPEKNLPLFIQSVAMLDAYQLRTSFSIWRTYCRAISNLRRQPLRRIFAAWKIFIERTLFCHAAAVVLTRRRTLRIVADSFWRWRTGYRLGVAHAMMNRLRGKLALQHWRRTARTNSNSRYAFLAIYPHVRSRAESKAFGVWMTVWLQRIRLQRVSNRIVCNRFDTLQRSAWAKWRGLYRSIKIYRHSNKDRLHTAAALVKSKFRAKQYLVDRDVKRGYFRIWIIQYSYRVRGQHVLSTWCSHHRRRVIQRALRQWILLYSVETIAICVQKSWRGYSVRFVHHPESWARLRWYRHYLIICSELKKLNTKKRVLRTWKGYLVDQNIEDSLESSTRYGQLCLRQFRHKLARRRYEQIALKNCGILHELTHARIGFEALDMWAAHKKRYRRQMVSCARHVGLLLLRRSLTAFSGRNSLMVERNKRKKAVKELLFGKVITRLKECVNKQRVMDDALKHHLFTRLRGLRAVEATRRTRIKRRRHVLLTGIGKPLLYKWVLHALGRRLARRPGHSKRLADMRRVTAVLIDRADVRREQYICEGSLSDYFVFPRLVLCSTADVRALSSSNGLKYCFLRRWHRKAIWRKTESRRLRLFQQQSDALALQTCLNRWKFVGFSQVRWRKAAMDHYRFQMQVWRVKLAFHELKRPSVLRHRKRNTLAVKKLLSGFVRCFRQWKMSYFSLSTEKARLKLAELHFQSTVKRIALEILFCRSRGLTVPGRWSGKPFSSGGLSGIQKLRNSANLNFSSVQRFENYLNTNNASRLPEDPSNTFIETPIGSPYKTGLFTPSRLYTQGSRTRMAYSSVEVPEQQRSFTTSRVYKSALSNILSAVDARPVPWGNRQSAILQKLRHRVADAPSVPLRYHLPFLSLSTSSWRITGFSKHLSEDNIRSFEYYRKLLSGMRVLYKHALYKATLRRATRRTVLIPCFKSWFSLYATQSVIRQRVLKLKLRILMRLTRGIFMSWAYHTMRCRRLAYQVSVVQQRRQAWSMKISMNHWCHLMAWDKCSRAFVSVVELRVARLLKRSFVGWRRARLVATSLNDALYQMIFTSWMWYTQRKLMKARAVRKANRYFFLSKCSYAIRQWRVWVKIRVKFAEYNSEGLRHYALRSTRRCLLYWLYWAWWMGRAVLFSRRKCLLFKTGTDEKSFHRGRVHDSSLRSAPAATWPATPKSPVSTPRRIVFSPSVSVHRETAGSDISSLRLPTGRSAFSPFSAIFGSGTKAKTRTTSFKMLQEKRLPWLARRVSAHSGRRYIPRYCEARKRRAVLHWLRIAKTRAASWRLSIRKRLFITWKKSVFSLVNLRIAFVSRMDQFMRSNYLAYYFYKLKTASRLNELGRKMAAYFLLQKQKDVLHAWKKVFWLRRRLRDQLLSVEKIACNLLAACRKADLVDGFRTWKVAVLFAPLLDLQSIGRNSFHKWRLSTKAHKFYNVLLLKRTLRAWILRVANLRKIRSRVLNIRKACSILETRLRNDAVMTMGLYFSKWSGRSALVASAPNDWKRRINSSKPLYAKHPKGLSRGQFPENEQCGGISFPGQSKTGHYGMRKGILSRPVVK